MPKTPQRVLSDREKADVVRRFERGDTIGLIAFALSCDKKLVSKTLREAGLDVYKRMRKQNVEWAWRGKK